MRVPVHKQVWWWSAATLVIVLALWGLGNVMTPFLIGAGIAYVLDPLADRLQRAGLSRTKAVALITLIAALAFMLVVVLLVPMLIRQLIQLIEHVPEYIQIVQTWLAGRFPEMMPQDGTLRSAMNEVSNQLSEKGGTIMVTVLSSLSNVISLILLMVVVPVVAFYLLLDWDHMVARVDTLLPREHADTIRSIGRQINESLAGFLRGQALVTFILASFYSTALLLVGLPFALVIGICAAVLSIVPYVGVFVGGVTSVAVAAFTFWDDPQWIVAVLAIFVVGQIVEGNYLQPKIIGGHVGLHPVWLMIALAVFGKLFGFVGLVVAVPLGAMMGVFARFFTERYKESAVYTGREVLPEPAPPTLIEIVPRGTTALARRRSEDAHAAAVAEVKVEEARFVAREAAQEAAEKDGAKTAVARVAVVEPGPEAAAATLRSEPEVKTWGGKTPDGTDPEDSEGKNKRKEQEKRAEEEANIRRNENAFRSGGIEEVIAEPPLGPEPPPPPPAAVPTDPMPKSRDGQGDK